MTAEQKVSRWPDADRWLEEFYTNAGKLLSDGVRPELADQQAWLSVSRLRRERGER